MSEPALNREYAAVKIESVVADRVAVVARFRRVKMQVYLSDLLRDLVDHDFAEVIEQMRVDGTVPPAG
jgi:hypothetical protein